jgi:sulfite reductase (ferredoxin)
MTWDLFENRGWQAWFQSCHRWRPWRKPTLALLAYEFLEEDQIIPLTEAVLRVFDRYGERNRRMKARMKFLLNDIGLEKLMALVEEERTALKNKSYKIDINALTEPALPSVIVAEEVVIPNEHKFQLWRETNVFEQKQKGFFGVYVKLALGNMSSKLARQFADVIDLYASPEFRITVNQGYLLRFVRPEALKLLYLALDSSVWQSPI